MKGLTAQCLLAVRVCPKQAVDTDGNNGSACFSRRHQTRTLDDFEAVTVDQVCAIVDQQTSGNVLLSKNGLSLHAMETV